MSKNLIIKNADFSQNGFMNTIHNVINIKGNGWYFNDATSVGLLPEQYELNNYHSGMELYIGEFIVTPGETFTYDYWINAGTMKYLMIFTDENRRIISIPECSSAGLTHLTGTVTVPDGSYYCRITFSNERPYQFERIS